MSAALLSFLGYRLLTEFFVFSEKFLFVDFGHWPAGSLANYGAQMEVFIYLNQARGGCRGRLRLNAAFAFARRSTQRLNRLAIGIRHQAGLTKVGIW